MAHGSTLRDLPDAFELSLSNEQSSHRIDDDRLLNAARRVLADSKFTAAAISLAVVDDVTIQRINREYLDHDWPTDVLSFVLEDRDGRLEGEVILSADTAAAAAAEVGWSAQDEQLLYVIHGMLHLVGYRDKLDGDTQEMRLAEARYLRACGIELPASAQVAGDASTVEKENLAR
jgi:probable rRNA maturation factor